MQPANDNIELFQVDNLFILPPAAVAYLRCPVCSLDCDTGFVGCPECGGSLTVVLSKEAL